MPFEFATVDPSCPFEASGDRRPAGWFNDVDAIGYIGAALATDGPIAEVGCMIGRSLSYVLPLIDDARRVVAVDNFQMVRGSLDAFRHNLAAMGAADRVDVIVGDSADSARHFADGYFSVVYIDAAHDFESVVRDVTAWLPKVMPGGFICGHDYGNASTPDVAPAVDQVVGKPDALTRFTWIKRV